MWELISCADEAKKHYLLVGKECVIGRRDCNITIPKDQSISRQHAILSISHIESNLPYPHKLPLLTVKDVSRLGTLVNNKKISPQTLHPLQSGDTVTFGTVNTTYRVHYTPLVATTSCLLAAVKKSTKSLVCKLGGHVVSEWRKDCGLLIMSDLSVMVKVICALVSLKPIVTPQYLEELENATTTGQPHPDAEKFIPPLAETQLDPNEVTFKKIPERSSLFSGKTFIFLSPKQFKKLSIVVSLAGGTPILMEEGTDDNDDNILVSPGTCVMQSDMYENTENMSQNAREWTQHVMSYISRHGKRAIPDSELGFAVLYCSMEKHCNPDRDVGNVSHGVPSQSLSEQVVQSAQVHTEILAANTEITPERLQEKGRKLDPDTSKINETVLDKSPESVVRVKQEPVSQPSDDMKKMSQKSVTSSIVESSSTKQTTLTAHFSRKRVRSGDTAMEASETQNVKSAKISTCPDSDYNTESTVKVKEEKATPVKVSSRRQLHTENQAENPIKRETDAGSTADKGPSPKHNDRQASPSAQAKTKSSKLKNSKSRSPSPGTRIKTSPKHSNKQSSRSPSPASRFSNRNTENYDDYTGADERAPARTETVQGKENRNIVKSESIPGFLNTHNTIQEGSNKNENDGGEDNLPCGLVITEFKSLIVRKQPKAQIIRNGDQCMWNGKLVKNFKKFRKAANVGAAGLPRIIGGSDLQAHINGPRKDLDEWFQQELEVESQQLAEERRANDLFDMQPQRKRRK